MMNYGVTDDRPVEEALREVLEPLDRQLARVSLLLPLAVVTIVPAFFFYLWLGCDYTGRRALIISGGGCCGLIAMYLSWEILASRLALRRFDRRFPPATPARAVALRVLGEMVTPSRAEEKLRVALACSSADRIVRQRRTPADTPAPDTIFLSPPTVVAPTGPPHIISLPDTATVPVNGQSGGRRPGGYYDYIPLEPRTAEPRGEQG